MALSLQDIRDLLRRPVLPVSGRQQESFDQSRLTLAFRDRSLERRYRAFMAPSAVRQLRVATLALFGIAAIVWVWITYVAPVVFDLTPGVAAELDNWRLAIVWFALPVLAVLYISSWSRLAERYYEIAAGIIYLLCAASCLVLIWTEMTEIARYYSTLYVVILTVAVYGGARMRFPVLMPLSLIGGMAFVGAKVLLEMPVQVVAADIYFLLLANLGGGFVAIQVEQAGRQNFSQRVVIEAREQEIRREREKSDQLLSNILPESIIARLKESPDTIADGHDEVTVLFADISGFTDYSSTSSPGEVVDYLNELFSKFDDAVQRHGLEKIKTIGDAYMVAAGVPEPVATGARSVAQLALDMRQAAAELNGRNNLPMSLRIGIHTGPLVAGVIGTKKFNYDIWGDTVNTASRMESHCDPGRIQVSESTWHLLREHFLFTARGDVDIKGKGVMRTWWLEDAGTAR